MTCSITWFALPSHTFSDLIFPFILCWLSSSHTGCSLFLQTCCILSHFRFCTNCFTLLGTLLPGSAWFASSLCAVQGLSSPNYLLNYNSHYQSLPLRLLIPFLHFLCRIYYHLTVHIFYFLTYAEREIIMFIALAKKVHVKRKFLFLFQFVSSVP